MTIYTSICKYSAPRRYIIGEPSDLPSYYIKYQATGRRRAHKARVYEAYQCLQQQLKIRGLEIVRSTRLFWENRNDREHISVTVYNY
jgi:hypothetical protein